MLEYFLEDSISWPDEYYYFRDEYLTYRKLKTKEDVWQGYEDTKEKLKTIRPCTDFSYIMVNANKQQLSTMNFKDGDEWPCMVRFPEQVAYLPSNNIFVVETDLDYFQQFFVKGVTPNLDIFVRELKNPKVQPKEIAHYDTFSNVEYDCEQLLELENKLDSVLGCLTGWDLNTKYSIPLTDCNLLPRSGPGVYSACFYDRHVAEVYAKSVTGFIQGCFDRYTASKRYYN